MDMHPPLTALYRQHLALGNPLMFRVTGGSMWPLIRSNDVVRVVAVNHHRVGCIYLYVRGERWFVHRLTGISQRASEPLHAVFQGDGLWQADPPVPLDDILGQVIGIRRGASDVPLAGPVHAFLRFVCRLRILGQPVFPCAVAILRHLRSALRSRKSRQ